MSINVASITISCMSCREEALIIKAGVVLVFAKSLVMCLSRHGIISRREYHWPKPSMAIPTYLSAGGID